MNDLTLTPGQTRALPDALDALTAGVMDGGLVLRANAAVLDLHIVVKGEIVRSGSLDAAGRFPEVEVG